MSEVLTLLGVVIASVMSVMAAVFTARSSRKTQEMTQAQKEERAREASEVADREGQRRFQLEMMTMMKGEVELLNTRMLALRTRLIAAEDETDKERTRRREMQFQVDDMKAQVERMKRILGDVVPTDRRPQYPDLFPVTPIQEP